MLLSFSFDFIIEFSNNFVLVSLFFIRKCFTNGNINERVKFLRVSGNWNRLRIRFLCLEDTFLEDIVWNDIATK